VETKQKVKTNDKKRAKKTDSEAETFKGNKNEGIVPVNNGPEILSAILSIKELIF